MKMKRIISIALTLLLLFSLASCSTIGGDKPDDNGSSEKIQETQTVDDKPVIKPDDNEKKEEEEIVDDRPDDPPFVKTLRTGVFGYEYRTENKEGASAETITFVYSDGSLVIHCYFNSSGVVSEWQSRELINYEKNEVYLVTDNSKQYTVIPDVADKSLAVHGIPNYRAGIEQTGHGTADCNGETLDYIDYISGQLEIRFFIKDGDTYAMRHPESDSFTFFFTKTYTSPPTAEYFEIPDDYESNEFQLSTPPG